MAETMTVEYEGRLIEISPHGTLGDYLHTVLTDLLSKNAGNGDFMDVGYGLLRLHERGGTIMLRRSYVGAYRALTRRGFVQFVRENLREDIRRRGLYPLEYASSVTPERRLKHLEAIAHRPFTDDERAALMSEMR